VVLYSAVQPVGTLNTFVEVSVVNAMRRKSPTAGVPGNVTVHVPPGAVKPLDALTGFG
jgi:hypothetical protein